MKPYNYFDDEEEQPQPSAQVRLAQLVAALQVNGAKLRRTVHRDEEIVEELRDYPNLRRAALKWLAVALFVLAVVIAIISFAVSLHNQSKWNERFCDQVGQVCTDYIAKYGACRWESMDERYGKKMARMTGVSYLRRMDFNGDGRDELLICYLEKGLYFFDIWGFDGKNLSKFYSANACYATGDGKLGSWVVLYHTGRRYQVGVCDPQKPTEVTLYAMRGKKFKKAGSCQYNVDTGVFSQNDKPNTEDFERLQLSCIRETRAEMLVDTVTAAMEEFNTKTTAEIEASLPDATLKKQAYYDVVDDLNRQYGSATYKTEGGIGYVDGLAVVEEIDFDGDGNKELLTVYRRQVKKTEKNDWTGEQTLINVPVYSLRVYNWNGSIAKCIFTRDQICQPFTDDEETAQNTQFYILRKSGKKTDLCFNAYRRKSQSVYTAASRIFRLKGEQFSVVYDAKMEYEYGYKTYYLDGESVYESTFNTKGYTVPYFMNDAGYDAGVFTVVYLSGDKTHQDAIRSRVSTVEQHIQSLNDEYVPERLQNVN